MGKYYYGKIDTMSQVRQRSAQAEPTLLSKLEETLKTAKQEGNPELETACLELIDQLSTESPSLDEQSVSSKEAQQSKTIWHKIIQIFNSPKLVDITFFLLLAVAVGSALVLAITNANGIQWLFELKSVTNNPLGEVAVVLAPLLALALGIERLVETVFDYFEGTIENIVELSRIPQDILANLSQKSDDIWEEIKQIKVGLSDNESETSSQVGDPLTIAEQKLDKISQLIFNLSKNPTYLAYKRRMAIMISFALGFIVAIWTDQGIFQYLQISVPRFIDILITGAVLGAGAEPMHSLIGALDGLKGTLKNLSFSSPVRK